MERFLGIRKHVIEWCRWLSDHGYFGSRLSAGGNVSARIPGAPCVVITPSGRPYQDLTPEEIAVVDFKEKLIDGCRSPSMETGMHIGIYETRPDVGAVVHTHQPFASVFALINLSIPALFDEVAMKIGGRVDVVPYALSGSPALAANVKQALSNGCNCYTLQNHGALNLGDSLETACKNAELLEKMAQVYHHALCTGKPVTTLPEKSVQALWAPA